MPTAFEKAHKDRERYVELVLEQMKEGKMPSAWAWNRAALMPHNPISKSKYHGGNRLKLMLAGMINQYDDPRWMTFLQIQEKGWHLKKGSHGVMCEKYIFEKKEKNPDTGIEEVVKLTKPILKIFYVYNASEVEGIEPFLKEKDETEILKIADDVIASSECPIEESVSDSAYYMPVLDKICVPKRQFFKNDIAFLSTVLHEMSHSTGHSSRLARPQLNMFGTDDYAKEELRAELGALLTQADLGIVLNEEHITDHSNYLLSWNEQLKSDPDELFRAIKDAEKIADRLVANYNRQIGKKTEMSHDETFDDEVPLALSR